uniref:Uncharacterized protein n=1 Tax=Acrobeloides nanus TaxID=290746 RepID=A0A914E9E8_9BILA
MAETCGIVVNVKNSTKNSAETEIIFCMLNHNNEPKLRKPARIVTTNAIDFKKGDWIQLINKNGIQGWKVLETPELPTEVVKDKIGRSVRVQCTIIPLQEDIVNMKESTDKKGYCVGYSKEFGKVLIAFENKLKKYHPYLGWVGTLLDHDENSKNSHVFETLRKQNQTYWVMSAQNYEEITSKEDAIKHGFNFVTGLVIMEKNNKMFVWNEDVGLLHFLKNPLLELKLGHWVEFSPIFYEKGSIASMVRRTKQMYETKVEGELIKLKTIIDVPRNPDHQGNFRSDWGKVIDPNGLITVKMEERQIGVICECKIEEDKVNWIISEVHFEVEPNPTFETSKPFNKNSDFSKKTPLLTTSLKNTTSFNGVIYAQSGIEIGAYVYDVRLQNPLVLFRSDKIENNQKINLGDWVSIKMDQEKNSRDVISVKKLTDPVFETRVVNGDVEVRAIVERIAYDTSKLVSYNIGNVRDSNKVVGKILEPKVRLKIWCKKVKPIDGTFWAVSNNPDPEEVQSGFGGMDCTKVVKKKPSVPNMEYKYLFTTSKEYSIMDKSENESNTSATSSSTLPGFSSVHSISSHPSSDTSSGSNPRLTSNHQEYSKNLHFQSRLHNEPNPENCPCGSSHLHTKNNDKVSSSATLDAIFDGFEDDPIEVTKERTFSPPMVDYNKTYISASRNGYDYENLYPNHRSNFNSRDFYYNELMEKHENFYEKAKKL